jgi:hypothetical protein
MKLIIFFPCKKGYRYYVKRQDFSEKLFENCARYGTGTVICQKSEPEPEP